MKLLSTRLDDYCVQKCLLAAKLAGISLAVQQGAAADVSGLALVMSEGKPPVTQHLAILRTLADAAPAAKLLGSSAMDGAQVDQWLAFTWQNIGKLAAKLFSDFLGTVAHPPNFFTFMMILQRFPCRFCWQWHPTTRHLS